jgi:hypothetical protein
MAMERTPSTAVPRARQRDTLTVVTIAALVMMTAIMVARTLAVLFYPWPLDEGEGCVLGLSWNVVSGRPLYGVIAHPPYHFSVYGPVFVYVSAWAFKLFGPTPIAPRVLASVLYLGIGLLVYLFVRRETGSRAAAVVAALFLLSERHLAWRAGLAVTDCPALFFSLLGLCLWRRGRAARLGAIAAFSVAAFTKQSSVLAAAAAFAALFLEGRRGEAILSFGGFCAVCGAALGACVALFGPAFVLNTFTYASVAPIELAVSLVRIFQVVAAAFVPFLAWTALAYRSCTERRYLLPVLYTGFGLVFALASGREGASRAYMFDFVAGMAIAVGLAWPAICRQVRSAALFSPIMAIATAQLALIIAAPLYGLPRMGGPSPDARLRDAAIREAYLAAPHGIVFSYRMGLSLGTQSENLAVDVFKLSQLVRAGVLPREVLLGPIRDKLIAMVIMPVRASEDSLFPGYLRDAILRAYRVKDEKFGDWYLVPTGVQPIR